MPCRADLLAFAESLTPDIRRLGERIRVLRLSMHMQPAHSAVLGEMLRELEAEEEYWDEGVHAFSSALGIPVVQGSQPKGAGSKTGMWKVR
ncbi:hypothetical protein TWF481_002569 [Arthrobotrys musiformis]|uniref:Uncharacterized protein n=1 Tax=Arthrobotrys musiformis TaxID=47236 RepID=A0AAV9VWT0_9PEZI